MISQLSGKIISKQPPLLVLNVQNVGYEIEAPMSTFYRLSNSGEEPVTLLTHLIVREDAHCLYGFATEEERRLFRSLIKVNGVGPKLAITILSGMETEVFVQCIQQQQISLLMKMPGIGKKTAERLCVELRDKLKNWNPGALSAPLPVVSHHNTAENDAINALVTLGYKLVEATQAVKKVQQPGLNPEALIRLALQQF